MEYALPELEGILKETLGVIVYQEQVMQISNVLASYSLGEADLLRRAMGKKKPEEMAKQRERFMDGADKLGHKKATAGDIFDQMEKFAGYGFNKSHSAAYALLAYQTAYLKTHYPMEFMAALLTSETSKPENVVKYIAECKEMSISVEAPDVQLSGAQFTPHGEAIRFGLAAVKNVGGNAIESILKARAEVGGRFKSFWEFCEKVDLRVMNKRVIESLIKAGALDSLGGRASLMKAVDKAMERAQRAQKDAEHGQSGLFGLFDEGPKAGRDADELPKTAEWEEGERLANEKEVLGFFVSGHPLDKYAEKLRNLTGVISAADALERKPPEKSWGRQADPADEIQVAGMILGLKVQKTKRDQKLYAQAALEDATGKIELVCFPRDYERLSGQLKMEAPVLVRGVLTGDEDAAPKIAVSAIQSLEEVQVKLPTGVRIRINLDRATEEMFVGVKSAADAAPGPGKVMMHLQRKGEYEVILEPEGMSVAADKGWVERVEELVGRGGCAGAGIGVVRGTTPPRKVEGFEVSHPSRKNKNAARVGHPKAPSQELMTGSALAVVIPAPVIAIAGDDDRRDAVIPIFERDVCKRNAFQIPNVLIDYKIDAVEAGVVEDPDAGSAKDANGADSVIESRGYHLRTLTLFHAEALPPEVRFQKETCPNT